MTEMPAISPHVTTAQPSCADCESKKRVLRPVALDRARRPLARSGGRRGRSMQASTA